MEKSTKKFTIFKLLCNYYSFTNAKKGKIVKWTYGRIEKR